MFETAANSHPKKLTPYLFHEFPSQREHAALLMMRKNDKSLTVH